MPITTHVVGPTPAQGEKYNIMWSKSQEDAANLHYKKLMLGGIKLKESMLHEIIISQMHSSRRCVFLISDQGHGQISYITNFLCTEYAAEIFPICNKIMFYHTCSLGDESASNSFNFIKEIAKNILSLFPQVGTKMYFDADIEDYLYGRKCSQYPGECIDSLIAKPLQDLVKTFGFGRFSFNICKTRIISHFVLLIVLHSSKCSTHIIYLFVPNVLTRSCRGLAIKLSMHSPGYWEHFRPYR
jgi:hypothetical protein